MMILDRPLDRNARVAQYVVSVLGDTSFLGDAGVTWENQYIIGDRGLRLSQGGDEYAVMPSMDFTRNL